MTLNDKDAMPTAGVWHAYTIFIKRSIIGDAPDTESNNWRDNLFANIITYFIPSSFLALVPGVIISFMSGNQLIGIVDILAFLLIVTLTLYKGFSLVSRKVSFVAILYSLSVFLTISLSLFGPGMIYLLTTSVLTSIILPRKWGFVSAFVNLMICSVCALLIAFKLISSPLLSYDLVSWIAVSSNLVFLSFVSVVVINYAITKLETTLASDVLLKEENKKVIKNLAYSEQRLLQAQALAHLGSWQLDFSTGVAIWSEEACRIYGLDPDDRIQSYENWLSFNHPDDMGEIIWMTSEARKKSSDAGFYHRILRKDGSIRHLYSQARYELDENGVPTGMYGVAHDVTELKRYQEDLRKSNERFELINKAAREAILDWDIINDVTYWGNGFTEIFGYAPIEYHDHLLSDNIHQDDKEAAMKLLQVTLDDPEKDLLYREFRYLRADRSIAFVQIRTVLIRDHNGKAIRAIASIMDVTSLIEKRNAIEKQNVALREIAWIQSHVIRSPLTKIMGLTNLLAHKNEHGLDEGDLIREIQTASDELDIVIRDIVSKTIVVEETLTY